MNKRISLFITIFCICCKLFSVEIERIVPITSDTHLKVEIYLKGSINENVELKGAINSSVSEETLWKNSLGKFSLKNNTDTIVTVTITGLTPVLWSPVNPYLYNLSISAGNSVSTKRIGFRRFEMKDGHFYLNGRPVYLRGNAINPPQRGIPEELETSKEFARDYVKFMKSININIIRIPDNQNWLDVCDEEGMMVFAGRYGRPKGATADAPPADFKLSENIYKSIDLGAFTPHPSVVIYVLSNEMPYMGQAGDLYREFLRKMYESLQKWDNTRLYICNAGYGLGKSADIYDVHRYWGWYYNSFLTYLNMRDMDMWQNEGRVQPITFTECVGNYTGIDGRFNLCSRTKQPSAQKCWTGHLPDSLQADAALSYQAFVMKNATEMFRRLRKQNDRLSGTMPFSILFHNWDAIKSFDEMQPKPAAYQMGVSYQPVLLSWENWQTQIYTGKELFIVAHVVNDDDYGRDLENAKILWKLTKDENSFISGEISLQKIPYYTTSESILKINIPSTLSTGYYKLEGEIINDGKKVSVNETEIFIAGKDWLNTPKQKGDIYVYDKSDKIYNHLSGLGYKVQKVKLDKALPPNSILIIGEGSWNSVTTERSPILTGFVNEGGRILCLKQDYKTFDTKWLSIGNVKLLTESCNNPEYLSPAYAYMDGMNINLERPSHPVFDGLTPNMFRLWSDYSNFDESKQGFPKIYPVTNGFDLMNSDLSKIAIIANYSRGLAATGLAEIFLGKGSILISGFDITGRISKDPVTDRFFSNMVNYMLSPKNHHLYVKVNEPIIWGDYTSEKGLVTGAYNGLMLNTKPIIPDNYKDAYPLKTDKLGYQYAGSYGGWNTTPGIQYVGDGRRAVAPFTYSAGGSTVIDEKTGEGEGFFFVSVPQSSKIMYTVFENVTDNVLYMTLTLNDEVKQTNQIPPHSTTKVETLLPRNNNLKVHFKGSRQLVIKSTYFH
ncbi:glycoside hydrolase family 2 TIM barrel-domain containing protein [Dysgonomonas sp.]